MAELDGLRGESDGFETGSTDFVDGGSFGGGGDTSADGYLTGGSLARATLKDMSKVDFFDRRGGDVGG